MGGAVAGEVADGRGGGGRRRSLGISGFWEVTGPPDLEEMAAAAAGPAAAAVRPAVWARGATGWDGQWEVAGGGSGR